MNKLLQNILSQGFLYSIGQILLAISTFILFPIYANSLSESDFTLYNIYIPTISILVSIIGLGINSSLIRSYFDYENFKEQQKSLNTSFLISFISSIAFLVIISLLVLLDVKLSF